MRNLLPLGVVLGAALAVAPSACSSSPDPKPAPEPTSSSSLPADCADSNQALVRRALPALLGRRAWGQHEINAYEDLLAGVTAAGGEDGRTWLVQLLTRDASYRVRWADFLMDSMRIVRSSVVRSSQYDFRQAKNCFGPVAPNVDERLAAWVRDNSPSNTSPPLPNFKLNDLISSSLALDDLSPAYRAQLFEMLAFPIPGANVAPLDLERDRRIDFGRTFQAVYIHRDTTCLPCHNSEFSVTYNPTPDLNRAWTVPGLFEKSLFGESSASDDKLRYFSIFRHIGVADGGGQSPWGWDPVRCGTFKIPQSLDPLDVSATFGKIGSGDSNGKTASVWQLEPSLRRGVDRLAAEGLVLADDGSVADPDQALAYLLAENIVEKVWTEVVGTHLTIANYFPRTAVQRDILHELTETFVRSHFSLKTLLVAIVSHPGFNLKAPEAGCGGSPYALPRLFNPWSNSDTDAAKHGNSSADSIYPVSTRPLRRSLHTALGWPFAQDFPGADEEPFQIAIGNFISNLEPGFRGLDFQARLAWEATYGLCTNPSPGSQDYISQLAQQASSTPGTTLGDALVTLKDRLLGEGSIDADGEQAEIEALLETPLSATNLPDLDAKLRLACGAYVVSPQFLLGGVVPADQRDLPRLPQPDGHDYAETCAAIASGLDALGAPYAVSCQQGSLSVSRR